MSLIDLQCVHDIEFGHMGNMRCGTGHRITLFCRVLRTRVLKAEYRKKLIMHSRMVWKRSGRGRPSTIQH